MKALTQDAVKQRLRALLAQAKGTRWDVALARLATVLGLAAYILPYVGLIPGKWGKGISFGCLVALALTPRITKCAGLLTPTYEQQVPFLKVLPDLLRTLLSAPQITAQAQADATAEQARVAAQFAAKQAEAEKAAFIVQVTAEVTAKVKDALKTGGFGPGELSDDVPPSLKQQPAPVATPLVPMIEPIPIEEAPSDSTEAGDQS